MGQLLRFSLKVHGNACHGSSTPCC